MRGRRLPAEWEPQDGVLLAWPHEGTDWQPHLGEVEPVFLDIVDKITRFERVVIVAPEVDSVRGKLRAFGVPMDRVALYAMETNDTWTRDFGPITVIDDGKPFLLDFGFNGWGLKFPACHDNRVTRRLHSAGAFGEAPLETVGLILEGGSIESDGRGTILTTKECLLGHNRNPHIGLEQLESALGSLLGADRIHWLENGMLSGDDTDGHIDTLARFGLNDTILHVACDDPEDEHFPAIQAMVEELRGLTTRNGAPYRLIPLPWPRPRFDGQGFRLPATYANFLVVDGAVLVPTYDDSNDRAALEAVGHGFPGRCILGVPCLPLIHQHGSLHCVTMQLPEGTLR